MVIATHIILVGYGHWLPNDIRGSFSIETLSPDLRAVAQAYYGMRKEPPSDAELEEFYRKTEGLLMHKRMWFDDTCREVIKRELTAAVGRHKLCVYACAILRNHVHMLVRRHGIRGQDMPPILKKAARDGLLHNRLFPGDHPVFSDSKNHFFKSNDRQVWDCINYINGNFAKHHLPYEEYSFIRPYEGEFGSLY